MLRLTSNECLVENNIFEHLRHAMIVQSGANGNVFSYNYSINPFWTSIPNNAAGDMVLHGNYPYANLFEQNVCRNIVVDNSHGANGPLNTFFRNRAEGFGIFFSANNSPNQNFIGNDIPNTTYPYSWVNYFIKGAGHFLYGNNNKGTINPLGTEALLDESYFYDSAPSFVPLTDWAAIGTPKIMGAHDIPAFNRYNSGILFYNSCLNMITGLDDIFSTEMTILLSPNPFCSSFILNSSQKIKEIRVSNSLGQEKYYDNKSKKVYNIDTNNWRNGVYFINILFFNGSRVLKRVVKK
jgi:hypothetical protein